MKLVVGGGKMFRFKSPTDAEVQAIAETQQASLAQVVAGVTKQKGPAKVTVNELWAGYVGEQFGRVEGTVVAIADVLGDWREELIVSVAGEVRIYTTTIPATTRRVCLMEDRHYRTSVARRTMGYFFRRCFRVGEVFESLVLAALQP